MSKKRYAINEDEFHIAYEIDKSETNIRNLAQEIHYKMNHGYGLNFFCCSRANVRT